MSKTTMIVRLFRLLATCEKTFIWSAPNGPQMFRFGALPEVAEATDGISLVILGIGIVGYVWICAGTIWAAFTPGQIEAAQVRLQLLGQPAG